MSSYKRITNYENIVKSVLKLQAIVSNNISEDEIFGNHYIVDKDKYDQEFQRFTKALNNLKINHLSMSIAHQKQEYGILIQLLDSLNSQNKKDNDTNN